MKDYLETRIQELKEERIPIGYGIFILNEFVEERIDELEKALTYFNQLKED